MRRHITFSKEVGETPLMALERFKRTHPTYADTKACYAGRLDPMAKGKLLVLLGEECKRQDKYHGLDKEYEIEVLLDVGSDTGDALGIVTLHQQETRIDQETLARVLRKEQGTHLRRYPLFSSKTVNGTPLFLHALKGTLTKEDVPEHEEHIYRISCMSVARDSAGTLRTRIDSFLSRVPHSDEPSKALGADFRINEVKKGWEDLLTLSGNQQFVTLRLKVVCGSGTYMRSLAGRIGKALGTDGLALSITRTKIGRRRLGFWVEEY